MNAHTEARYFVPAMAGLEHAHMIAGVVEILRDLAQTMATASESGEIPFIHGELAGWVQRLDLLGNVASASNDQLIEALHKASMTKMGCNGSFVRRDQ